MQAIPISSANNHTQNNMHQFVFQVLNATSLERSQTTQSYENISINQLNLLHDQFHSKLQKINKLNSQFSLKQQKMFLKTFINIMDKMSNQLQNAVMACQNIDQQIKKDSKCILLAEKLKYFKTYYLNSEQTLKQSQIALGNQIQKNSVLKAKKQDLLKRIFKIHQKNERQKIKGANLFIREDIQDVNGKTYQPFYKIDKHANLQTKPTSHNISRKISLSQSKLTQTQNFNSKMLRTQSINHKSQQRQTKLSNLYMHSTNFKNVTSDNKLKKSQTMSISAQQKLFKINQFKAKEMSNPKKRKALQIKRKAHTSYKRINKSQVFISNDFFDMPHFQMAILKN